MTEEHNSEDVTLSEEITTPPTPTDDEQISEAASAETTALETNDSPDEASTDCEENPSPRSSSSAVKIAAILIAAFALLACAAILVILSLTGHLGGDEATPTAVTTTTATATTTTAPTTTTTRIWNQNGRNICKTCNYVYDETLTECPACAGQEVSPDSQCPTCLGAHDTDEGQAWEYCSFCQEYFIVTQGAVHTCVQCETTGLLAEQLDPEKGLCANCINGTHVCGSCGANCHGLYRLNGAIACESCYGKVMWRTCEWCYTPKASARPINSNFSTIVCDDCFICRREATPAEYDAYIAWYESTYGPLHPMLGLNGRLEVCPHCGGKSVHNGIVFDCDDCGRHSLPCGMTR